VHGFRSAARIPPECSLAPGAILPSTHILEAILLDLQDQVMRQVQVQSPALPGRSRCPAKIL